MLRTSIKTFLQHHFEDKKINVESLTTVDGQGTPPFDVQTSKEMLDEIYEKSSNVIQQIQASLLTKLDVQPPVILVALRFEPTPDPTQHEAKVNTSSWSF